LWVNSEKSERSQESWLRKGKMLRTGTKLVNERKKEENRKTKEVIILHLKSNKNQSISFLLFLFSSEFLGFDLNFGQRGG